MGRYPPSPPVERACLSCGTSFFTYQSEIRKQGGKYCSVTCYRVTLKGNRRARKWDWESGYGRCSNCERVLPISEFRRDSSRSTGVAAYCVSCHRLNACGNLIKRRMEVLIRYGGNPPKCECCHENIPEFLTIDHIDGGGRRHRRELGTSTIYSWLRRRGFPLGFRVLCMNCNWAMRRGPSGQQRCPGHETTQAFK